MRFTALLLAFTVSVGLSACSSSSSDAPEVIGTPGKTSDIRTFNAKPDRILLQHPTSREIVECNSQTLTSTGLFSAEVENCAKAMEGQGFIRVTDIPRFMAKDDKIQDGNYPSRRYRGQDVTPRW
ncbi:MAG: hypothetical protein IKD08_00845 [Alphaproteobacteria bacterium]|nr:hypothetical protein [Alphaproteobacteria bacterium]